MLALMVYLDQEGFSQWKSPFVTQQKKKIWPIGTFSSKSTLSIAKMHELGTSKLTLPSIEGGFS
jgi:hypothetical protein